MIIMRLWINKALFLLFICEKDVILCLETAISCIICKKIVNKIT